MQRVLRGREGEVDQNPQDHPGPRLAEELPVEAAGARVERGADHVRLERVAQPLVALGLTPADRKDDPAQAQHHEVRGGDQRAEVIEEKRRGDHAREDQRGSRQQGEHEGREAIEPVGQGAPVRERGALLDASRQQDCDVSCSASQPR